MGLSLNDEGGTAWGQSIKDAHTFGEKEVSAEEGVSCGWPFIWNGFFRIF